MLDLGTVKPGSTIRIPFSTFDKDDGSSITMTNFAVADILIYKDGGTTERASTAGYTATTDFDAKTGKHLIVIDLADNTTAGFFAAGSEYLVAIDAVTVDAVTTGGWVARFAIGYPGAILDTTIATLSSQTSFTLTAGPAEDDALNGCVVVIHDVASAVQAGTAVVLDYTGSTKTVTLAAGTTFTAAATDNVSILPPVNLAWAAAVAWGSGAITAGALATGAITAAKFAAGAIDAAAIATGAIDADAIADNAIDAGAIATGAITAAKFAAGAIDAAAIAADALGSSELAASAATEIAAAVSSTLTTATDGAAMAEISNLKFLSHQSITDVSSATSLTVPSGAKAAILTVTGASVRMRLDGTNPTTTVGQLIAAGSQRSVYGQLAQVKLIETTASAAVWVDYYTDP